MTRSTWLTAEQDAIRQRTVEYADNLIAEISELARQRTMVIAINRNRGAIEQTVSRELCSYLTRVATRGCWLAMARAYDPDSRSLTQVRAT